jgi:hypothetical protein
MRSGHTSSDVQLLKAQLEDSLNSFGIKVVLKPPYNHEYVIDETALENLLANEVSYRSERPLITDVDSLSAIFRLRRGRVSEFIENCTAVFLTTNTDLARASRTFFSSICASGTAAICVTDYILTNLVWLKNPIKASDLPNRLAIANSYAALQPSEQLWVKYIEEIKKLLDRNRISPDDYYLLRVSMDAKKALMDLTRGEDVDLTGKTVEQILETVKSKIRQDAQRKLQTEAEKHAKTKAELTRKEEREIARRLKVEATAAKVAHGVTKCFLVVVFILLSFGAFLSFPRSQYDVTPSFYLYLPSLFQIIIVLCGILNFTFGVTLRSVARRLEIRLKNILIRKLHRFMGLD